jgi:diadenosine tetraphosphate (Ap4A) HIT family hydrolase
MSRAPTRAASSACWCDVATLASCELCVNEGGESVCRDDDLRVVRVVDESFPAFYRVIWNAHVAELSDLSAAQRQHCIDVVVAVERTLREQLHPTKINLASLGNMVPHLHWHVIARFDWDSHFPQPIWGTARRVVMPPAVQRMALPPDRLDAAVRAAVLRCR